MLNEQSVSRKIIGIGFYTEIITFLYRWYTRMRQQSGSASQTRTVPTSVGCLLRRPIVTSHYEEGR
jgi:hypothetical protein